MSDGRRNERGIDSVMGAAPRLRAVESEWSGGCGGESG